MINLARRLLLVVGPSLCVSLPGLCWIAQGQVVDSSRSRPRAEVARRLNQVHPFPPYQALLVERPRPRASLGQHGAPWGRLQDGHRHHRSRFRNGHRRQNGTDDMRRSSIWAKSSSSKDLSVDPVHNIKFKSLMCTVVEIPSWSGS